MDNTHSGMFNLGVNDLVRSAVSAAFVAVVVGLAGVVGAQGFDLFTADWLAIGKMALNMAVVTFVGRIAEKFVTASNGKVFGRLG